MLYKHDIEVCFDTIVGKIGFASHTKPIAKATQGFTSFMRDNM